MTSLPRVSFEYSLATDRNCRAAADGERAGGAANHREQRPRDQTAIKRGADVFETHHVGGRQRT